MLLRMTHEHVHCVWQVKVFGVKLDGVETKLYILKVYDMTVQDVTILWCTAGTQQVACS